MIHLRPAFLWTLFAFVPLWLAAVSHAETRSIEIDFDEPSDLAALREQYTTDARYPHETGPGADGKPGFIASLNRGGQGEQAWLTEPRFDLRREAVTLSVDVQAEADEGGGLARIFLGLAERADVNLQQGAGKLGVRVFKGAKPKFADRPYVLQLVNGIATRNLGQQFALETGKWYRLSVTLAMEEDKKSFRFDASLHELSAEGKPSGLSREESGTTSVLQAYRLNEMAVGLLGQNRSGGAIAFDNLKVSAEPLSHAPAASAGKLEPITFLPAPLRAGQHAPGETMFGACGHFMHTNLFYQPGKFSQYWQLEYTLPYLVEANLGWVREPVYQGWFDDPSNPKAMKNRETVERYLQMYEDHGVRVMLVPMAAGDSNAKHAPLREGYFEWIAELVYRYDCIEVVEMHNEPNLKFFWQGTVEDYVRIYREGARIIRERNPDAKIAVGSMSSLWWGPGIDWFKKMAELGGLEFADAVAVHPYQKKAPPERDPHFEGAPIDAPDHFEQAAVAFNDLVQSLAPEGKKLDLYYTELGYSSGEEGMAAVGDTQLQADYLSRSMMLYLDLRVKGMPIKGIFWYDLKNDGTNEHGESNFGLISYDTSRTKPAYGVYRRIAGTFTDPEKLSIADAEVTSLNLPEVVNTRTWRHNDGRLFIPFWRMEQLQQSDADFATRLDIAGIDAKNVSRVILHALNETNPRDVGFESTNDTLSVPVSVSRRASYLEIHF
jgi:hypothetical protein